MRAVIVAGVRTPFARAGSVFKDLSAIDLGEIAVRELMDRLKDPKDRRSQESLSDAAQRMNQAAQPGGNPATNTTSGDTTPPRASRAAGNPARPAPAGRRTGTTPTPPPGGASSTISRRASCSA